MSALRVMILGGDWDATSQWYRLDVQEIDARGVIVGERRGVSMTAPAYHALPTAARLGNESLVLPDGEWVDGDVEIPPPPPPAPDPSTRGATGVMGPTGPPGIPGTEGPPGVTGPLGPQGVTGATGIGQAGVDGVTGATGGTGPQGDAGSPGTPGAAGITGATGVTGTDGASGTPGTPGIQGIAGPTGPTGATGTAGGQGSQGVQGNPGTPGAPGSAGVTGPTGATGPGQPTADGRVITNVTNTLIVAANVTGLSFLIAAGEVWSFEAHIQNGCSGTGGVRFTLTVPAGAAFRATAQGMAATAAALTSAVMTVSGTLSVAFNTANLATGWTKITGLVRNGATPGTVQVQFAAGTAAQTATVFADSFISGRKVA